MDCPACRAPMKLAGTAKYERSGGVSITPIVVCRTCDIYGRVADPSEIADHSTVASYVQSDNEARFHSQRTGFFTHLLEMLPPPTSAPRLLDFGSAYGHLLQQAAAHGYSVCGVEIVESLVRLGNERGLLTVSDLADAPGVFHVILMIDSLYYIREPKELLTLARCKMTPDGSLVVRVTNRNRYVRFVNRIKRTSDLSNLGDVTFSYSLRGVRRLLTDAGFVVEKVSPDLGTGKADLGLATQTKYALGGLLARLSRGRLDLAPGLIVFARPAPIGLS